MTAKKKRKSGPRAKPRGKAGGVRRREVVTQSAPPAADVGPASPDSPAKPDLQIDGDQTLAAHYGVTTKTIYDWRHKGLPHTAVGRGFAYDLEKCDAWIATMRESHALDDTTELNLDLKKAELRISLARAEKLEREERLAGDDILSRNQWELFAAETIQEARDRFLRIPKYVARVVGKKQQRVVLEECQRQIERVLTKLAGENVGLTVRRPGRAVVPGATH